jgi:DNA polymerase-3 subunit gamma/tau
VALLGVTDIALIDDVVDALAAGDRAAVFETVDRLVEAGLDPRRFAADLLQRLRDLTLVQAIPDAAQRGLVDAGADEAERMVEQAARLGPATLVRYGEILHAGLIEMRGATAPRLLLELLCARMLLPAASTAESALLERLERIERRASIAPAPVPHGESAAAPPSGPDATQSAAARRRFARTSRSEPSAAGETAGPARAGETNGAGATATSVCMREGTAQDPVGAQPGRAAIGETRTCCASQAPEPTVQHESPPSTLLPAEPREPGRVDHAAPTSVSGPSDRRCPPTTVRLRRSRHRPRRASGRTGSGSPRVAAGRRAVGACRAEFARRRRRPAGLVGDPRRRQAAQP